MTSLRNNQHIRNILQQSPDTKTQHNRFQQGYEIILNIYTIIPDKIILKILVISSRYVSI